MNQKKGGMKVYKPKLYGNKEMEEGLRGLFSNTKQQQQQPIRQNTQVDAYGMRQPQYQQPAQPVQQQHGLNIPNYFGQPQSLAPKQNQSYRQPVQQVQPQYQPPQPQQVEEEPYWSAEQWEDWAISMYENVEESRAFLPEWVIKAMEQQG